MTYLENCRRELGYKDGCVVGFRGLGVVYIIDNKVFPCSLKTCDWALNLSMDHFDLHKLKTCHSYNGA